jgi:molybdopterin-guanine dinucleotide biosynthesis protein A
VLPAEGLILAGGESRRMGRDKALLEVAGRTLLEWGVATLEGLVTRVAIGGRDRLAYDFVGLPTVPDALPGGGPLAPIVTALGRGRPLLVLAADLYPVAPAIFLRLWQAASETGGAIAVVDGQPQPLLAVYHPSCLPAAAAELAGGRRLKDFARRAGARELPVAPGPININTEADLLRVMALGTEKGGSRGDAERGAD